MNNKLRFTVTMDVYVDNVSSQQYIKDVIKERLLGEQDPIVSQNNEGDLFNHDWLIYRVWVERNKRKNKNVQK